MAVLKGKTVKPSKVVKPTKRNKRTTETTRNHRFQPFSERIAKLKIDPIRRRRNVKDTEELSVDTTTYFGRSLAEWQDLNLTTTFTAFSKAVGPLCDSLPMVLHNDNSIVELLVSHIEKGDAVAMEPLLDLLSHFARDLDARFEKHFQRAVSTVAATAAKHPDPAVIEWSFTCLAWLFKHLSRLLVCDLRSLYDLMSPYLGKEPQKPFVIRFAAESLSFLVRKTAVQYERDPAPLDTIMGHMLADWDATHLSRSADLYRQGIMTLLTEAVKGFQRGIHSGGVAIIRSLLRHVRHSPDEAGIGTGIAVGTLTSLIHSTDAEGFDPIVEVVLQEFQFDSLNTGDNALRFASDVLLTISSVRKGNRVSNWPALVKAACSLVEHAGNKDGAIRSPLLSNLAVAMQSAPIDAVLPVLGILDTLQGKEWAPHFLRFCDLFSRLGFVRFKSFVLPHLQEFLLAQWKADLDSLTILLPRFARHDRKVKLQCEPSMQEELVCRISVLGNDPSSRGNRQSLDLASAHAAIEAVQHLRLDQHHLQKLQACLESTMKDVIATQTKCNESYHDFALGSAFATLLETQEHSSKLESLWPFLCDASPGALRLPAFWSNLLAYIKACRPSIVDGPPLTKLEQSLVQCLAMPSHAIREPCLEILRELYELRKLDVPAALKTAIQIESTPVRIDTSRAISMHIRALVAGYAKAGSDTVMQRAIPAYCFGMLHIKLAQAWDDVAGTLAEICKSVAGEEAVISIVQTWLESTPDVSEELQQTEVLDVNSQGFQVASDFECSNLAKISAICKQVFEDPRLGYPSFEERFRIAYPPVTAINASSRSQALRVLKSVPHVAEKRSRLLVPVLLQWAGDSDGLEVESSSGRWSRTDQKAMLAIFAQFNNPRVLYRSSEVHDALLNLCANGDAEIQHSALKAILAWKDPAIVRYAEHLDNLLDDARFREEVSVFLQGGGEDTIQSEHQADLMPLLLRLLYGRAVGGGRDGQQARRKAVFIALSRFGPETVGMFVDLVMSSAVNSDLTKGDSGKIRAEALTRLKMAPRQQVGMLNMVSDMLEALGPALEPFALKLMDAILWCTINASNTLEKLSASNEPKDASMLKTIRQAGFQCLVKLFSSAKTPNFETRARIIVNELVVPRLEHFARENTQSVSGMLRLFATWSASPTTVRFLAQFSDQLVHRINDLLSAPAAKDDVKVFVLQEVLDNMLADTQTSTLQVYVPSFVRSVSAVLSRQPSKEVLEACVVSVSQLAAHISSAEEAHNMTRVCADLLKQPNKFVSPATKTGLLRTLLPLLDLLTVIDHGLYETVCGLCSRLSYLESRTLLSQVLEKLCREDAALATAAVICMDLNSLEGLDSPDHERRARGFNTIFARAEELRSEQWLPILHNCLFFIRNDDMVTRANASRAMETYLNCESKAHRSMQTVPKAVSGILLPGIAYGMRSESELVRAEYVRLLEQLVIAFPAWHEISELHGLAASGNEEESFFHNILHIQLYQRIGALKRLADESSISSKNVTRFFLPLLEHFVFDQAEGDTARTLADRTVMTIGSLARTLKWSDYRATLKRYYSYLKSKSDLEKTVLRLIGALIDGLATSDQDTAPMGTNRATVVENEFLPPLTDYLHRKDESTVDRRVAVAVSIVKLLRLLPDSEFALRLAPVLTDVCQILRSRDTEARDQTRKTLASICNLVGARYFGFIVKELRSALQRGYQLHVLSFTVHSLLVNCSFSPGDLDNCLPDLTAVVMDDIFSVTGQEKDAEEYKTGMKEIKSNKSFDTLEILARTTPVNKLGELIRPVRAMLQEKLDSKAVKKIDELLNRIRRGIDQNEAANDREMLIFSYEMVRQVYAERAAPINGGAVDGYRIRKYLIELKPSNKSDNRGATGSYTFKLTAFALNLVRKIVRRHEALQIPANMAGYLPVIGDAIVEGHEEVQLAAVKLLTTIIRVPLKELDDNAPVYLKEAMGIIKGAARMTADAAKAALELLTAILQHKQAVTVKENDIAYLLKTLKPDLDEPDHQGIIYKFLRAVLGRKIVITEVYEVMDEVGKMMVTNPDDQVRQNARSAYLHFVLEYPHGRGRWAKSSAFLVKNLEYEHKAGRTSVMEFVYQLLNKLDGEPVQQILFTLFVGLVTRLVSDNDSTCRDMAGILIGKVLERADEERLKILLEPMRKWMGSDKKVALRIAALKCWSIYVGTKRGPADQPLITGKETEYLLDQLVSMVQADPDHDFMESQGQLLNNSLQLLTAVSKIARERTFAKSRANLWSSVQHRLGSPHPDVKLTAAMLVNTLFNDIASAASKTENGLAAIPLSASGGLALDDNAMRRVCALELRILRTATAETDEELLAATVRNLVFLGRSFAANDIPWRTDSESQPATSDDEEQSDTDATANNKDSSALGFLLDCLSRTVRRENGHVAARTRALACQTALVHQVEPTKLHPSLHTMLRPLYSLTDPSTPFPPGDNHQHLQSSAKELTDLLQKKVDAERFRRVLGQVGKEARERRDERRRKRRVEAVSEPEAWAREKRRRYEVKKARMKEKGVQARGKRRGW